MTYDPLGRGTRSTGTGNTDYYYTAAGERILRVDTSGSAYTFRDAGDRIATEYAGITPSRDNVFLGILLVGSYSNSTFASNGPPWLYYSSDHLGTPRLLTDNLGEYVESRRSWPFGEDVASPAPPQPFQRLRYATMERDPEGSRYYDHARSHSFGLARFMSPDKLGGTVSDPQSWNRYTYTGNNPLKYIDPDGRVIAYAESFRTAYRTDPVFRKAFQLWKATPSGSEQWRQMGPGDTNTTYTFEVGKVERFKEFLTREEDAGVTLPVATVENVNANGKLDLPNVTMIINVTFIENNFTSDLTRATTEIARALFEDAAHGLDIGSGSKTFSDAWRADSLFHQGAEPRMKRFEEEVFKVLRTAADR